MDKELLYVWLNKIRGVGPILANNLIECFSDIDEIYHADISELLKVDGIGEKLAKTIVNNKDLDESKRVIQKCNNNNIEIINKYSSNYPKQLSSKSLVNSRLAPQRSKILQVQVQVQALH